MQKPPRSSPNAVRVVELLAFPLVQLLDVTGPFQVFASANDLVLEAGGRPPYDLQVVAQSGSVVVNTGEGIRVVVVALRAIRTCAVFDDMTVRARHEELVRPW